MTKRWPTLQQMERSQNHFGTVNSTSIHDTPMSITRAPETIPTSSIVRVSEGVLSTIGLPLCTSFMVAIRRPVFSWEHILSGIFVWALELYRLLNDERESTAPATICSAPAVTGCYSLPRLLYAAVLHACKRAWSKSLACLVEFSKSVPAVIKVCTGSGLRKQLK
jgi:hypothetical protein